MALLSRFGHFLRLLLPSGVEAYCGDRLWNRGFHHLKTCGARSGKCGHDSFSVRRGVPWHSARANHQVTNLA